MSVTTTPLILNQNLGGMPFTNPTYSHYGAPAIPAPAPATEAPPAVTTTAFKGSQWRVIWPSNVFVRAGPDRDMAKVGELIPGSMVTELAREGDWIQHAMGWTLSRAGANVVLQLVSLSQVVVAPTEDRTYAGAKWRVVWPSHVFVRAGPDRETAKVAELLPNQEVVELARCGEWIKHSLGWTLARAGSSIVLAPDTSLELPLPSASGASHTLASSSDLSFATTSGFPATSLPATGAASLALTGAGFSSTPLSMPISSASTHVAHAPIAPIAPTSPGSSSLAPTASGLTGGQWKCVWSTAVYVRNAPTRDAPKTAELAPGTNVIELGRQGDWIRHALGWSLVRAGSNTCMERVMPGQVLRTWRVVWTTNCFVRARPDRDSPKIGELPPGTRVLELEREGEWIRHATGWTLVRAGTHTCLDIDSTTTEPLNSQALGRMWKVVWSTNCYCRDGPGREFAKIGELAPGSKVVELDRQGDWIRHAGGWTLLKAGANVCLVVDEPSVPAPNAISDKALFDPAHGSMEVTRQPAPTRDENERFFD